MGTEQKNLDVPDKVAGRLFAERRPVPGMKWAAVKVSRPGGGTSGYNFDAIR
jgi:hypothetical protein